MTLQTQQFLSMGTFLSITQMVRKTIAKVLWRCQIQLQANAALLRAIIKVVSHLVAIKWYMQGKC